MTARLFLFALVFVPGMCYTLFDVNDIATLQNINLTNDGNGARLFFIPQGMLLFNSPTNTSIRTRDTMFGERFSGGVAPMPRLATLPPVPDNSNYTVDIDYTFLMYNSTDNLTIGSGHGTSAYLVVTDDISTSSSPTGIAFQYGSGIDVKQPTSSDWPDSRVLVWPYESIDANCLLPCSYPTMSTNKPRIRYGKFRLLLRLILFRNGTQTLEYSQIRLAVEGNPDFSGIMLSATNTVPRVPSVSAKTWINYNASRVPNVYLWTSRTSIDILNLTITATPASSSKPFDDIWNAGIPPTTRAPTTTIPKSTTSPPNTTGVQTTSSVAASSSSQSIQSTSTPAFTTTSDALPLKTTTEQTTLDANSTANNIGSDPLAEDKTTITVVATVLGVFCFLVLIACVLQRHIINRCRERRGQRYRPIPAQPAVDTYMREMLDAAENGNMPPLRQDSQAPPSKPGSEYGSVQRSLSDYSSAPAPKVDEHGTPIYEIPRKPVGNTYDYTKMPARPTRSSKTLPLYDKIEVDNVSTEDDSNGANKKIYDGVASPLD